MLKTNEILYIVMYSETVYPTQFIDLNLEERKLCSVALSEVCGYQH